MMKINITPLDPVFFRKATPFRKGLDTWAESRFPPQPSVLYGALRSRYFSSHPERLPDAASENDPTASLKFNTVGLIFDGTRVFPLPRDFVQENNHNKSENKFAPLYPKTKQEDIVARFVGSAATGSPLLTEYEVTSPPSGTVLQAGELQGYLNGELSQIKDPLHLYAQKDHGDATAAVVPERRTGIALNPRTRTTKEGELYTVEMLRLNNISFYVEFEGLNLEKSGLLKIGGKSRAARYGQYSLSDSLSEKNLQDRKEKIRDSGNFKLYLATPAIFNRGWHPFKSDPTSERTVTINGISCEFLSAAVGKPDPSGGWDIKYNAPKPMRKTVPAGSVYHLKLHDLDETNTLFQQVHNEMISHRKSKQGYGHALVGVSSEPQA